MYAVIRAGGKQYRVAPGDVIKIEKAGAESGNLDLELLAVSSQDGKIGAPGDAKVTGEIVGTGRGDKILVFHYKSKKQYKKLNGHRQPFTAVRITEITADGNTQRAEATTAAAKPAPKKAAKKTAAKKTTAKSE